MTKNKFTSKDCPPSYGQIMFTAPIIKPKRKTYVDYLMHDMKELGATMRLVISGVPTSFSRFKGPVLDRLLARRAKMSEELGIWGAWWTRRIQKQWLRR